MQKTNFCTLFDSGFLSRGLALYSSLQTHCQNFHLYIFAFDDLCFDILTKLSLPNVTVIPLKEFEDPELLKIKSSRSRGEYCWTSTPSTILYCIEKFNLDHCTYLDADIFFFDTPDKVLEKFLASDNSVLITPHYYTPVYDQSKASGVYCVQFMPFKNNADGLTVLRWWREQCLEWCFARVEDGKFGDQKYLDVWPEKFKGVYVEPNIGVGLAPWNVQQVKLSKHGNLLKTENDLPVVFYHFHGLKFYKNKEAPMFGWYYLNQKIKELIYKPYFQCLDEVISKYDLHQTKANYSGVSEYKANLKDYLRQVRHLYRSFLIKVKQ